MNSQRTLSVIKPDGTRRNITGAVNAMIEQVGLRIIAQKRVRLQYEQAAAFYAVHAERSFFASLCLSMSAGPIVVQILEGENAVEHYREIMGATEPSQAATGTIRQRHGLSIETNTVHGSDSVESAHTEIAFFFNNLEIVG